jgi:hypothetical protein
MHRLKNKELLILGLLFLLVAFPRSLYPDLDHADEYSDANVLNAGENFAKLGFIKCRFLPMFEPGLDSPQDLYTHYPPLGDIFNGLLRVIFKSDSLRLFRGVSLFFSLFTLLFWYLFVKVFTRNAFVSILAALFYLSSPLFLYGLDSLGIGYTEFLRSTVFLTFIIMVDSTGRRKKVFFTLLWGALVLESLFTFDYIIYFSLFFLLFKIVFRKTEEELPKAAILLLFLAPVFGFLLHLAQNIWYFGGVHTALQDMKNIAVERAAHSKDSSGVLNFPAWWQYVITRNFSLVLLFNYFILLPFFLFAAFLYRSLSSVNKKEIGPILRLLLIFAVCGISWYILFPSHSFAHTFLSFLSRHLMPFAAITFALFCYIVFSYIKINNPRNLAGKIILGIIILAIIWTGITQSSLPVTSENISQAKDFLVFKGCLLSLKARAGAKEEIGVNYFRYPFIRYYTGRHTIPLFDKQSLTGLPKPPEYFIFMPYGNPAAQELFQYLNQEYDKLFQCGSAKFPAVFFKLKAK